MAEATQIRILVTAVLFLLNLFQFQFVYLVISSLQKRKILEKTHDGACLSHATMSSCSFTDIILKKLNTYIIHYI